VDYMFTLDSDIVNMTENFEDLIPLFRTAFASYLSGGRLIIVRIDFLLRLDHSI
jgi:hypothetical protein